MSPNTTSPLIETLRLIRSVMSRALTIVALLIVLQIGIPLALGYATYVMAQNHLRESRDTVSSYRGRVASLTTLPATQEVEDRSSPGFQLTITGRFLMPDMEVSWGRGTSGDATYAVTFEDGRVVEFSGTPADPVPVGADWEVRVNGLGELVEEAATTQPAVESASS